VPEKGMVPVVSATTQNNGVTGFAHGPAQFPANCLTVANGGNGSGCTFYHQYPFHAVSQATVLCPKFAMTPLAGLFLTVVINREKPKYSFSRRLSLERLQEISIRLPVDVAGQPDCRFMDTYLRRLRVANLN
jgi:hypothetical protein